MFRPSRRAVVIAASFALAFASVAPSAHADRGGGHDDDDEQSGDLFDLIDITDVLGGVGLPAPGGVGLPALGGVGLPGLDGLPPIGLPIPSTGPGLDLNVLIRVSQSGAITVL